MEKILLLTDADATQRAIDLFKEQFNESDFDPDVLKAIGITTSHRCIGANCQLEKELDRNSVCIVFSVYKKDEYIATNILSVIVNKLTGLTSIYYKIETYNIPKSTDISDSDKAILQYL
jgi:hypothetical protein